MNSISVLITKKTFDDTAPTGAMVVANIPFTNTNLTAGTTVNEHYRSIAITTPFFVNDAQR